MSNANPTNDRDNGGRGEELDFRTDSAEPSRSRHCSWSDSSQADRTALEHTVLVATFQVAASRLRDLSQPPNVRAIWQTLHDSSVRAIDLTQAHLRESESRLGNDRQPTDCIASQEKPQYRQRHQEQQVPMTHTA